MPERVVEAAIADPRRRARRRLRFRAPLSLIAALLAIALVVAVLAGGQVLRDWRDFLKGASPAQHTYAAQLAQLESRPLHLPTYDSGPNCTSGPYAANGNLGSENVSFSIGNWRTTDWGVYWNITAVTDAKLTGLILIRGRDLIANHPAVFIGPYAAGPIARTDTLDGAKVEQHLELVFDLGHPPPGATAGGKTTWQFVGALAYGDTLCDGWQVDHKSFSEVSVTNNLPVVRR
jgi:hypothetical protein